MSIVVGYIPTPEGRAALRRAAEEATLRGKKLIIVHSRDGAKQEPAAGQTQLESEFAELAAGLDKAGIGHEVRMMDRGTLPSEDLTFVAEETNADLIVIGLRRRSPVGKLFLGSNAQDVLLSAECAVLSVRAPK